MAQASEEVLLDAFSRGDASALGQLLVQNQDRVYNVCLRMVSNRDDALELAQETMTKGVQHVGSYNKQARFSTWLMRIAINLCISFLRKKKHRNAASLESQMTDTDQPLRSRVSDDREPSPQENVQRNEMLVHLSRIMNELEEDLRAVLVLRDINEMDYQSIAYSLSVPVGTVKSRLFRARLAIRHEMMKVYPPGKAQNLSEVG